MKINGSYAISYDNNGILSVDRIFQVMELILVIIFQIMGILIFGLKYLCNWIETVGAHDLPSNFGIKSAYPNPFNPVTHLRYDLPKKEIVNITIYDMMGKVVKTLVNVSQTAGFKSVQWNATNDKNEPVPAGLYLYTFQAGKVRQTKKMVLLK